MSSTEVSQRISGLMTEMTLEEKVSMTSGSGVWHSTGIERLGIPRLKVTDGPNGARGDGSAATAACFPCGTALGATWDTALVGQVGNAIGEGVISKGAHLLLAPTINIHRTPLGGRNFECYSEDPYLTGALATEYINGVQSTGVGATAKHFVGNDSEFERHTINSVIDERTLREVYLRPFEHVVDHSTPVSIMSSYNRLNGTSASDNHLLLTSILKDEWGFDGFVISDWFGTRTATGAANAGLDLEMPGPPLIFGQHLLEAVRSGAVSETTIDDKVRRILTALERTGAFDHTDEAETSRDEQHHRDIARAAATGSTVMLRNVNELLPLDPSTLSRLAVIGPNADVARIQGGGSAGVSPHYTVTPLDGLRAALGPEVEVVHEAGCNIDQKVPPIDMRLLRPPGAADDETGRWHAEYRRSQQMPEEDPVGVRSPRRSYFRWMGEVTPGLMSHDVSVRLTATLRPDVSGAWTLSLVSAGKSRLSVDGDVIVDAWTNWTAGTEFYGNGCDEVTATFDLVAGTDYDIVVDLQQDGPPGAMAALSIGARHPVPDDLLARAERLAESADAVVLVVGQNSDWETEGRDRDFLELPAGQPELISRIAALNSRTVVFVNAGSPVDMAWAEEVPSVLYNWYPGQENGNAVADIVLGLAEPGGRLPCTLPVRMQDTPSFGNYPGEFGEVRYGEGLLVGHRWYDTRDIEPAYPFGHGMSFTKFEWETPKWSQVTGSGDFAFSLDMTNIGDRDGSDVVQIYAHRPGSAVARPEQQLVGFTKVHLDRGTTQTALINVGAEQLRHWDPDEHAWLLEPGPVEFRIARSSRDVHAVVALEI